MVEKRFCHKPFDFFEVDVEGNSWCCCQDWLDQPIGNLNKSSFAEVWNSSTAQEIRASILDGSFRYCNSDTCPSLIGNMLPVISDVKDVRYREIIRDKLVVLEHGPRTLNLGNDNSCNLACPTCRNEIIAIKGAQLERANAIQAKLVDEAFEHAECVIITGHGDAFASSVYRNLLRTLDITRFPNLRLILMTNGLLLTPQNWSRISGVHGAISGISISIDAASDQVYSENRGGNFDKLKDNLAFLADRVACGALDWLEISFVVQLNNFQEMKSFVSMAKAYNCSSVLFQKLIHWGHTYDGAEFRRRAIHLSTHPNHQDFLAVLADDDFGDPLVDLSNLANLRSMAIEMANSRSRF